MILYFKVIIVWTVVPLIKETLQLSIFHKAKGHLKSHEHMNRIKGNSAVRGQTLIFFV
jgi:hypothetical protein